MFVWPTLILLRAFCNHFRAHSMLIYLNKLKTLWTFVFSYVAVAPCQCNPIVPASWTDTEDPNGNKPTIFVWTFLGFQSLVFFNMHCAVGIMITIVLIILIVFIVSCKKCI